MFSAAQFYCADVVIHVFLHVIGHFFPFGECFSIVSVLTVRRIPLIFFQAFLHLVQFLHTLAELVFHVIGHFPAFFFHLLSCLGPLQGEEYTGTAPTAIPRCQRCQYFTILVHTV